jgi:hypothetical protein
MPKSGSERKDDHRSDREADVLRLLALGHTSQEISEKLFVSVRTAETHLARTSCRSFASRRVPSSCVMRSSHTGEMWNSNSVISWLTARSGLGVEAVRPPAGGRTPGWRAGLVIAHREETPGNASDATRPPRLKPRVGENDSDGRRPAYRGVATPADAALFPKWLPSRARRLTSRLGLSNCGYPAMEFRAGPDAPQPNWHKDRTGVRRSSPVRKESRDEEHCFGI